MTEAEAHKNVYCGFKRYVESETTKCSDIHHRFFIESDSDIELRNFFEEDILEEDRFYGTVHDAFWQAIKCLDM